MTGSAEPIQVLHVDSDDEAASTLSALVERERDGLVVFVEASAATGFERLATEAIDCVVCGTGVAGTDRLEFLRDLRARQPAIPVVALVDETTASVDAVFEAGATDVLRDSGDHDEYAILARRIERVVAGARSRQRLAENEAALSVLDGDPPLFVYRADADPATPMSSVAGGCEAVTGYPAAALESGAVAWSDLVHSEDKRARESELELALADGDPWEVSYRIETADDETRWVAEYGRGHPTGDGGLPAADPDAAVGFVTDLTGTDAWRERFERERNMLESLLTRLPEAIYFKDTEGRHVRASRVLHETHEDLIGKTDAELYDPELAADSTPDDMSVIETETPIVDKVEPVPENRESDMWTVSTKVPWYGPDGELRGLIGHSKTLFGGSQPLDGSGDRELEDIAATVTDEVVPHLETALAALDADDPTTVTEGERALETARDMLEGISRRVDADRPDETRTVDVRTVVRDAWRAGEADGALTVAVEYGHEVETNAVRFQQLFEELFRSMADATAVRVERTDDGFVVESDAPSLLGPTTEDVDDLVDRAPDERALALHIVRGIADTLGWTVSVRASPETVRVELG